MLQYLIDHQADVNFKVVKSFTARVKERCLGTDVLGSLNPGQQVVKIVNEELTELMGGAGRDLVFSQKGITVIPCAYIRQYIEWAPRGSGSGAPIHIYPATSDILSRTHREPGENKDYLDNGNYIENTANHYVMVVDADGTPNPALIVMKSTQLKKSRKWNSMMQSVKLHGKNGLFTPPMYSQMYRLSTQAESNDKGKWFGWEVERIGTVEDEGVYQIAKAFAQSVSSGQVKPKHEGESEPSAGAAPF